MFSATGVSTFLAGEVTLAEAGVFLGVGIPDTLFTTGVLRMGVATLFAETAFLGDGVFFAGVS